MRTCIIRYNLYQSTSIQNYENNEKEYAMKSDFMKRSLKSLQKYIILDLVRCGIIGMLHGKLIKQIASGSSKHF